ncbi:hypothetical protein K2E95_22000 [Pseudomonas sp. ERGC3:01]|nr:hypothetical protein [Pseudomonas sp. ERGC3:01]
MRSAAEWLWSTFQPPTPIRQGSDLKQSATSTQAKQVHSVARWLSPKDGFVATSRLFLPAYQGQLTRKYGASLNGRTALNCAQVICLIDLLCNLLSVSQELQLEARKVVHDIAFLDTIPY